MNHGIAKTLVLIVGSAALIAVAPYLPNPLLQSNAIRLNTETKAPIPVVVVEVPKSLPVAVASPELPKLAADPAPTAKPGLLTDEANALFAPGESPEEAERRLQHMAEALNETTAAQLAKTALDDSRNADERFLATYVIGQRPKDFTRELRQIALIRPRNERDTTMQIQAMLALETGRSGTRIFNDIRHAHHNPLLIKIAQLGIRGAQDGRPLIHNYIDMRVSEILDAVN